MTRQHPYRLFQPTLRERAEMLESALQKARRARVPEDRLKGLNSAQDVLDAISSWLRSKEYMDMCDAESRTEEHDNILRFIQWYCNWADADAEMIKAMNLAKPMVTGGGTVKWLRNMMYRMIKSGKYDPQANLKRKNAPWGD